MPLTVTDVKNMILVAHQYDQRHEVTEAKIASWHLLFTEQAPTMTAQWAQRQVVAHYARTDMMLVPSKLVREWKDTLHATRIHADDIDAHCGRSGCTCTHNDTCYRGWVDLVDDNGAHLRTAPCPVCRPQLQQLLKNLPDPGKRGIKADLRR